MFTLDKTTELVKRSIGALLVFMVCTLLLSSMAQAQDKHTIRFSFHRLVFDRNADDSLGYLLIIDNLTTETSYCVAYDGEEVHGLPERELLNVLSVWTAPSDDPAGYWSFAAKQIIPDSRIEVEESDINLLNAMESLSGDEEDQAIMWFESLLNRLETQGTGPIIGQTGQFRFADKPAFPYLSRKSFLDGFRPGMKRMDVRLDERPQPISLMDRVFAMWQTVAGLVLGLFGIILFLFTFLWGPSEEEGVAADSSPTDKTSGAPDSTSHREHPAPVVSSHPGEAKRPILERLQLKIDQRKEGKKQEQRARTERVDMLENLLSKSIDALNEQHLLAVHYYQVVKSAAERMNVRIPSEREVDPSAMIRLLNIEDRSIVAFKKGDILEPVIRQTPRLVEKAPSQDTAETKPEETDTGERGSDSAGGEPETSKEKPDPGVSKAHDDQSVATEQDDRHPAIDETGAAKAPSANQIPPDDQQTGVSSLEAYEEYLLRDRKVPMRKDFLRSLFRSLHRNLWMGRYLEAGMEDYRQIIRGEEYKEAVELAESRLRQCDHSESKSLVPRMTRVWTDQPTVPPVGIPSPERLALMYPLFGGVVSERDWLEKSDHDYQLKEIGYRRFVEAQWPLSVFRSIDFAEFGKVRQPTWETLSKMLEDEGFITSASLLARDLRHADIDLYLDGLDLPEDVKDTIRVACIGALSGPRLSELLETILKEFARICLTLCADVDKGQLELHLLPEVVRNRLSHQMASASRLLLAPLLKSHALLSLVWGLAESSIPKHASQIRCALHPMMRLSRRAQTHIRRLIRSVGLEVDNVRLLAPAKDGYIIEKYENHGRSVLIEDLRRRFGDDAFRKFFSLAGIKDGDDEAVVDIAEWEIRRDGKVITDCRAKVFTFGYLSLKIGSKAVSPGTVSSFDASAFVLEPDIDLPAGAVGKRAVADSITIPQPKPRPAPKATPEPIADEKIQMTITEHEPISIERENRQFPVVPESEQKKPLVHDVKPERISTPHSPQPDQPSEDTSRRSRDEQRPPANESPEDEPDLTDQDDHGEDPTK
ncbi:MAG: hypothetical protein OEV49_00245 [candidate division Zixibacteria bacterium]|nr:hypothetical protein [candidate division Zixibacteria bacterium]MDH3936506.1 hypothetical protein [candidate division Zixibacteria bacterium]